VTIEKKEVSQLIHQNYIVPTKPNNKMKGISARMKKAAERP